MSAWRREAEAVLGTPPPAWCEWGEPWGSATVVLLSFVGHAPSPEARRDALARLAASTAEGARLIVADHNRPRGRVAALAAVLGSPSVPGLSPARRWQRLAYPTARELQAAGFRVERMALVAGERVQLVIARRVRP